MMSIGFGLVVPSTRSTRYAAFGIRWLLQSGDFASHRRQVPEVAMVAFYFESSTVF